MTKMVRVKRGDKAYDILITVDMENLVRSPMVQGAFLRAIEGVKRAAACGGGVQVIECHEVTDADG